jgi:two-component system, sensor histidine kinase and response regulator
LQSLADTTSVAMENAQLYERIQHNMQEVLKLNRALSQQNEELERFAYICSHDMHEPVRMMNTYSMLLSETNADRLDEKGTKYLSFVRSNAQRLREMIDQILTFARIGREEVDVADVKSNDTVAAVIGEFQPQIEESNAQITCDRLPVLRTNPFLLQTLFRNLIGNALKFRSPGRTPKIHIGASEVLRDGRPAWQFSVRDNGIGIEANFRDRVFTIFQRIHRKEDYPGSAIGLSVCKKFIELVGGSIDFDSTPGEGTTFCFTLPAIQGSPPQ